MVKKVASGKWQVASAIVFCGLLASPLLASQMAGAPQNYMDQFGINRQVTSESCVGGPPDYCAATDMRPIYQPAINYPQIDLDGGGPAVGVPFIDPGSGNEFVRVTDYNTADYFPQPQFNTNSAAEEYSCSAYNSNLVADLKFDANGDHLPWNPSDGGYVCKFLDGGNNDFEFALDAVTMQTQILEPASYISGGHRWLANQGFSLSDPWLQWGYSGSSITYSCLAGSPASDPLCGGKGDTLTTVLTPSAANCPNIPSAMISAWGMIDVQASHDDTIVGGTVMTSDSESGRNYYIVYNRSNGNCFWFDANHGQYGGTGITGVQTAGPGIPAAPPVGTQTYGTAAGSLTGTYCVEATIVASHALGGETLPDTPACPTLSAENITINRPTQPSDQYSNAVYAGGAPDGWVPYACQESSPPTPCTNFTAQSSEIAWSTASFPLSSYATSGNAAPTVSGAGMILHQARLSPNGQYVEMTMETGGAYGYGFGLWQVGTGNFYFVNEGGHQTIGYNQVAVDWNNNGLTQLAMRSTPNVFSSSRNVIVGVPTVFGYIPLDSHPAWTDDNSSDTYPVCASYDPATYNGTAWSSTSWAPPDGTTTRFPDAGWTNAAYDRAIPYIGSNICWSVSGPAAGSIYRFGSHRSAGVPYDASSQATPPWTQQYTMGSITPDGKFMIFYSFWDWSGCSATGWKPDVTDSSGAEICDRNGMIQKVTAAGTRGTAYPPFSETPGETTTDGTDTWTAQDPCSNTSTQGCYTNVFVERLR